MSATPDDKDRQINTNPIIYRRSDGEFHIKDLLIRPWAGPDCYHALSVECEYCHLEVKVILSAPVNVPEFVKDEARRLVVIEHLRSDHKPKRNSPSQSDSNPN